MTPIEVACDESGHSGTNILDPTTEVFSHASVRLTAETATQCVAAVRAAYPVRAVEYKSGRLLRDRQRPVLEWFLGPAGPIYGRANVHLTDKAFFLAIRIVGVLVGESGYAAGTNLDPLDPRVKRMALAVHRQGPATYGRGPWRAVLEAFIALVRTKRHDEVDASVDSFLRTVADLRATEPPGAIGEIVALLGRARPRLVSLQARLLDDRTMLPPLELLMPALVQTALHWGAGGGPVAIVHDEQSGLTRHRVAQIEELLLGSGRLGGFGVRQVDSRSDPRVQVADLLAGAARRIASEELRGRGDAGLTTLLRPYLDPHPIWADDASWSRLSGGSDICRV